MGSLKTVSGNRARIATKKTPQISIGFVSVWIGNRVTQLLLDILHSELRAVECCGVNSESEGGSNDTDRPGDDEL